MLCYVDVATLVSIGSVDVIASTYIAASARMNRPEQGLFVVW